MKAIMHSWPDGTAKPVLARAVKWLRSMRSSHALLAFITMLASPAMPAAPVNWLAPQFLLTNAVMSGSEVENNNILLAKTFNPAATTPVNGVAFSTADAQNGLGVSWSSPVAGAGISNNLVTQGSWVYTSPAFTQVLNQGIDVWQNYADGSSTNTFDLTIGGLTPGAEYTVQFFVAKFNSDFSNQTITSGGSVSAPMVFANEPDKKGSHIIGSFVADGPTQVFTFTGAHWATGNAAATLNAVTVAGAPNPGGSIYHVSPTGVDAPDRDGLSPATAWSTPGYALGRVPPGTIANPNTIFLAAGSYTIPQATIIPPCVNLQGAGTASTAVNASLTNSNGLFRLDNSGYNQIQDIAFSGNNRQAGTAFWLSQAHHFTLANVSFSNFASTTIDIGSNCGFITVTDASFSECGYESFDYSLGAIGIYQLEDGLFSRITMRSTLNGTGYGFKAAVGHVRRTIFEHLDIRLKNPQAWNNMNAPNFALEFWHSDQSDNILRYSYFGGNSVSQDSGNPSGSGPTMRIHDNVFNGSNFVGYSIEAYTPRMEIDHNHFIGGFATIVWFNPWGTTDGMYIHHNVAEDVGQAFYTVGGTATNLRLEHNTVYFANSPNFSTHAFLTNNNPADTPSNWSLRNNIVVAPAAYPGIFYQHGGAGPQPTNVTIAGNIHWNMNFTPPTGADFSGNLNSYPGLRHQGAKPDPFFRPAGALSTAVDAGVDLGQPFSGAAPDSGAYEFTGITQPVSDPLLLDNFQSGSFGASSFNSTLSSDQQGQLAPLNYSVMTNGQDWQAQHGNGGTMLLAGDAGYGSRASLNQNFATVANKTNLPIAFEMDALVTDTTVTSCWSSITIGSGQNIIVNSGGSKFGILPTLDGGIQIWVNGIWQASAIHTGNTYRIVLSNTAGNGSAFNGTGSQATLFNGETRIGTYMLPQLTPGDGYLSFGANPYNGSWNITRIDNLHIELLATDFDTWANTNNLIGGAIDDDDHDGRNNFEEYAFGLDPKNGGSTNPNLTNVDSANGTITYTRRKHSLTGLACKIWTSANLSDWTEGTTAGQSATPIPGTDNESVSVTLTGFPSSEPRIFLRISAE